MPRTKILQIFSRYIYYGGEEGSVYRIGDALQDEREVEYFLSSTLEMMSVGLFNKLKFPAQIFHNKEIARRLRRFQDIGKFDVWQIHNVLPAMSPVVYRCAFDWNIPILHYLHNYRFGCTNGFFLQRGVPCQKCIKGNFWPAFFGKSWHDSHLISGAMGAVLYYARHMEMFNRVNKWIAISHVQKRIHLEMGIPKDNIEVVHHFYERQEPAPPPATNGYALFIGRLSDEKGVMHLLEAWKILGRSDRRLVIAGEGPELSRLQAYASTHGLGNVTFTGFVPKQEQAAIWAGAAFSVVPSIWEEPFGMVVLEAWARGRTVIAHRIGALPELIVDGENGFLVEPFQPQLLAEKLNHAFNSPQECAGMGHRGGEQLDAKFGKAAWLRQMNGIYRSIGF
jgi:glycosyltransferase involved in cell wall biosynthesis